MEPGNDLHIGILWEDYAKNPALQEYGLPTTFTEGREVLPSANGGTTKANQHGRKVRTQPEQKTTRTVHISYFRKKDGAHISYNRDFNVYVTELASQYDMKFIFKTNEHGQQVVVSPRLHFSDENDTNLMNTHAINLFLEVFGDYEVFDKDLNPAIRFTRKYDTEFLKKGTLTVTGVKELIEAADKHLRNPTESKAFAKRLFTFIEYHPKERGKTPLGFYGYIVFGFPNRGIVVLESMYKGHATYVFDESNYEEVATKTKQEVYKEHLYKERFVHTDDWEKRIRAYMDSFGVKDEAPEDGEAPVTVPAE